MLVTITDNAENVNGIVMGCGLVEGKGREWELTPTERSHAWNCFG